jgi:cytochrome c-type biogenesis protein CcmH
MDPEARTSPPAPASGMRHGILWIVLACVPAALAVAYVVSSDLARKPATPPAPPAPPPHARDGAQAAATASRLAAHLRDHPDDAEGWSTLGRSLAALGRFAEAAEAFAEAGRRLPPNAAVLADRADVLAMAQGRRFAGEPDRLIAAALALDARHAKALALAGSSAFDRADYREAASYWRRLLAVLPPQSAMAKEVEARTREAEARGAAGR